MLRKIFTLSERRRRIGFECFYYGNDGYKYCKYDNNCEGKRDARRRDRGKIPYIG